MRGKLKPADTEMSTFDPIGWLSRFVPEDKVQITIRAGAVALYLFMVWKRIREYPQYLLKPLWAVETLLFLVLAVAFFTRTDPIDRSKGVREVLVPLIGSVLPFGLFFSPPSAAIARHRTLAICIFWGMTFSTLLTVWGMWTLRRSFSITVEARSLVTNGPYRFLRHPVYLGEVLATGMLAIWRPSIANLILFVVFTGIQCSRAKWEEAKLEKNFPEYKSYAGKTWWIP